MAISYAEVATGDYRPVDNHKRIVDITLDGSYPANGYALDNAQMGMLTTPLAVEAEFVTGEGFNPTWIQSTNKIKIYKSAAGATAFTEVAAGDLTSSMKIRAEVTGLPRL